MLKPLRDSERIVLVEILPPLLATLGQPKGQPPPPQFAGGPELAAILHYLMRLTAWKKPKKKRPSLYDLRRAEQMFRALRILKAARLARDQGRSVFVPWSKITSALRIDNTKV
jgi:hypothetical protein